MKDDLMAFVRNPGVSEVMMEIEHQILACRRELKREALLSGIKGCLTADANDAMRRPKDIY